ncbi:Synaptophysin [Fasciola hepatica]|uniref:Synaptophysin n=1 Tax=Fasciola hepatica TaxID=6192 RepID=A0A4E0RPB3_FASHE|nr:Synaptophysin [Fasciola hepatica]
MDASARYDVLKEPRGFIKFIQILMAICAFATTCDFSTSVKFVITCDNSTNKSNNLQIAYPFRVNSIAVNNCPDKEAKNLYGDFSSSAQFFVFSGVMVFLLCVIITGLYVLYDDRYKTDPRASQGDFIFSIIVAILWFIASAAWADGVQQFKFYTQPSRIFNELQCTDPKSYPFCIPLDYPTYGGLNASLVFGFANIALWAASLWFLWKETSWSNRNDSLIDSHSVSAAEGSPM